MRQVLHHWCMHSCYGMCKERAHDRAAANVNENPSERCSLLISIVTGECTQGSNRGTKLNKLVSAGACSIESDDHVNNAASPRPRGHVREEHYSQAQADGDVGLKVCIESWSEAG
jgi:hypothetical protein